MKSIDQSAALARERQQQLLREAEAFRLLRKADAFRGTHRAGARTARPTRSLRSPARRLLHHLGATASGELGGAPIAERS